MTKSYRGNVTEVLVVLVDGQLIVAGYTSPHPLHVVSKDVTKKISCMNLFLYKLSLVLISIGLLCKPNRIGSALQTITPIPQTLSNVLSMHPL